MTGPCGRIMFVRNGVWWSAKKADSALPWAFYLPTALGHIIMYAGAWRPKDHTVRREYSLQCVAHQWRRLDLFNGEKSIVLETRPDMRCFFLLPAIEMQLEVVVFFSALMNGLVDMVHPTGSVEEIGRQFIMGPVGWRSFVSLRHMLPPLASCRPPSLSRPTPAEVMYAPAFVFAQPTKGHQGDAWLCFRRPPLIDVFFCGCLRQCMWGNYRKSRYVTIALWAVTLWPRLLWESHYDLSKDWPPLVYLLIISSSINLCG